MDLLGPRRPLNMLFLGIPQPFQMDIKHFIKKQFFFNSGRATSSWLSISKKMNKRYIYYPCSCVVNSLNNYTCSVSFLFWTPEWEVQVLTWSPRVSRKKKINPSDTRRGWQRRNTWCLCTHVMVMSSQSLESRVRRKTFVLSESILLLYLFIILNKGRTKGGGR